MKNLSLALTFAALAVIAVVAGCIGMGGSGSNNNNSDSLTMQFRTWDTPGSTTLSLSGPDQPSLRTVTYFVFGSDTNLGKTATVPLEPQRLDEQQYGPLVYGDKLENVDLSPWNQYDFLYLRQIGADPNMAFRLDSGIRYEAVPH